MDSRELHARLIHAPAEFTIVETWVAIGWLTAPPRDGFGEVDRARAQLICDLCHMGVNEEGIPIILDLVDQLNGVRRTLRDALAELAAVRDGGEFAPPG
jgi:chaperone modulatory protein CbpM